MATRRIPSWQLERHRLGELPSAEAARIADALAGDAEARAQIDELEADDARVLDAHPPRAMAAAIRERMDRESRATSPSRARVPFLSAAAAAICLLALLPLALQRSSLPETRIKGLGPSLLVFRESANRPEPLAAASVARADDVIQLAYQAAGRPYGVVISIDGRGHVTRHLPKTGDRAARLESGAPVALSEAYRLDDAPGFELFFLVTADAPFSVEAVVREAERQYEKGASSARAGIRLELPPSLDQFRFELRKEGSR